MVEKWARGKRGSIAEKVAVEYLENQGLKIITTNFRWKGGEIDIIASEDDLLVFVEVRSLHQGLDINPILTIGPRKREKIRRSALFYLTQNELLDKRDCRFDVIGVIFGKEGREILHLRDAFRF